MIEVDGARFATVPVDAVQALDLKEGKKLSEDVVSKLSYAADVEASHRVALRLLASRPRAVNELLRRLRERGHNPSAVAEAVGRLEEAGLLDDSEFAEHFVRVRASRGYGRSRLLRDLLARGVERRVAERAIDRALDHEGVDQSDQVRELAAKRARQLRHLPPETKKRRLLAYLERRGFRGREVMEVVEELARGEGG